MAWTSPVTRWLRSGGYELFESDNFSRVALLPEIVRALVPNATEVAHALDGYDAILGSLQQLDASTFSASRSPFLMTYVNRALAMAAANDEVELARAISIATLHLFDCFQAILPVGATIVLDPAAVGPWVYLPAQARKVAIDPRKMSKLVKTSHKGVVVDSLERTDESIAVPGAVLPIKTLPVVNRWTLLLENSPTLFEPEYAFKCYPDTSDPSHLAELISDSLAIIFAVWPDLEASFAQLLRLFVPIRQTAARTHNSFSAQATVGLIFLSESYDDLKLAEAIVHEFHHNELYTYMQLREILAPASADRLYYSPWRADARPLFGLLHGCYVFSAVAHYMRAAEASAIDSRLIDYFANSRALVVQRLGWALVQINVDDVTPLGAELVEWMRQQWHEQVAEIGYLRLTDFSDETSRHLEIWRATHPTLAGRVRRPDYAAC